MVDVGSLALVIGLVLALYAVGMSLAGAYWRKRDFIASAEHAALAVWGLVTIAVAALMHALVTHDFSLEYVAHYTSSTLPLQYVIAALWGGQAGSLLFWLFILTSMTAVGRFWRVWQIAARPEPPVPLVRRAHYHTSRLRRGLSRTSRH